MYPAIAKSEWKGEEQVSGNETVLGRTVRNRTDQVLPAKCYAYSDKTEIFTCHAKPQKVHCLYVLIHKYP